MMQFPLYLIRKYVSIEIEGPYKVITTAKNRYILDFAVVNCGSSYSSRRLELLKLNLPYSLYPINYIIREQKDLIGLSGKLMYSDTGKLHKYVAKHFYGINAALVESSWYNDQGYSMIKVKGFSTIFKTNKYNMEKYAIVAHRLSKEFLLGFSDTAEVGQKRIKI